MAGPPSGLFSGLAFAGVNRHDRRPDETILTALEVADLDLSNVEMAVLSACETGRGVAALGEGVLGLQRAFQLAGAAGRGRQFVEGARRGNASTSCASCYKRIWSLKPMSRAEALRQAQIWMLENRKGLERPAGPHEPVADKVGAKGSSRGVLARRPGPQGPPLPYYWAAFVLSGDWR